MEKGKKIMCITIGLVCFVLTYVMSMQFKTVEQTNITGIEAMTETELRQKLASWKERYEETYEKLIQTDETLSEYRQKRELNLESSELLEKELLQAKILAGMTDVRGNGVTVTLTDYEHTEKIDANDLVMLVNELKYSGAEAISINDLRIVNMSDIVDIQVEDGSEFILINKKRVTSPYVVKAIGDQKYLESALTTKTVGYIDRFSSNATLDRQNNIKILKYENNIEIKYANVKEED